VRNFKLLSVTILSIFFLQACILDDDDDVVENSNLTTIVDAAISNGNFTTLVSALQVTGLDATLADENGSYTVFAPTDAAFALLGQETLDALIADPQKLGHPQTLIKSHLFTMVK